MISWGDIPVLATSARIALPLYGGRVAAAAWRRLKPANCDHAPLPLAVGGGTSVPVPSNQVTESNDRRPA